MSSTPQEQLEFLLELIREDILPRLHALEAQLHDELPEIHYEIHWLDENLRIEYPHWYQPVDDEDED